MYGLVKQALASTILGLESTASDDQIISSLHLAMTTGECNTVYGSKLDLVYLF